MLRLGVQGLGHTIFGVMLLLGVQVLALKVFGGSYCLDVQSCAWMPRVWDIKLFLVVLVLLSRVCCLGFGCRWGYGSLGYGRWCYFVYGCLAIGAYGSWGFCLPGCSELNMFELCVHGWRLTVSGIM